MNYKELVVKMGGYRRQLTAPTSWTLGKVARMTVSGRTLVRICLLLATSCAVALHASEWRIETMDPLAGMFSSMKIDLYGNAHLSYLAPSENQLRYGFWDHLLKKWFTTDVDVSGGFCTLVLDSHQHPHISYDGRGGGLMYAHWDGTTWKKEKIALTAKETAFYTSIALDKNDYPTLSFYETISGESALLVRLRSVTWNGNYWALTTVDSAMGSGKFNSIAIDSKGTPHIAYGNVNSENASLRYASWNGESWKVEILEGEGAPGSACWSVSLLLDKDDNPHITYTDVSHVLVKYATKKDGRWKLEAVDSITRQGYPDRNGIALDERGNPYMSYFDAGRGVLKVAHRENQKWMVEELERGGLQSSVQVHHGTVWVSFGSETGGTLKVARKVDATAAKQEKPTREK